MATNDPSQLPESADIVIVGAGISALYSAWRIRAKNPNAKIVLLERLNRTGGRLNTDLIKIENASGTGEVTVREEEGGMRFTYDMVELMSLFAALNLCGDIVPFPMTGENNRYYVRGRSFTVKQAADSKQAIWKQLYRLAPAEQDRSPVDLLTEAYHQVLAANGKQAPENPTPEYWQEFRLDYNWKGTKLYKWQLWGLLRDLGYSEECVTMLSHAIGFEGPYLSLMNAGEAFQLLEDFPAKPNYFTFQNGFSTLPNTLVEKLESQDDFGGIFLGTNVDQIVEDGAGFKLHVTMAPPKQSSNPWVKRGVKKTITAGKVILAVARKALETLYVTSPVLHDQPDAHQLWDDLQTTTNQRLCKINLYFEEPWWRDGLTGQPPIEYGPSFTDLPANTVYPFYAIEGMPGNSPAALTIYCDWDNTNFWQGLQNVGKKFSSPLQKTHSVPPQTLFPASEAVVAEARRQFREIYKTNNVPPPVMTSFRLWDGEDDFGYAVHQWALNADDRGVIARLAEPVKNIYTCNEAYSDMQGWVNGSLRSTEVMLAKFQIGPLHEEQAGCQAPVVPDDGTAKRMRVNPFSRQG